MGKIKGFNLKRGHRVDHYEIHRALGRGWTAEAYLCEEVATGARRVIKFYERNPDHERVGELHDIAHFAWVLEQVAPVGLLPRYHHMGHAFLESKDGIGVFYIVQEYLAGRPFDRDLCTDEMVAEFKERVRAIHALGYAVGDLIKDNLLIEENDGNRRTIRLVDCDYGTHDKPRSASPKRRKEDVDAMEGLFGVRRGHS